MKPQLAHDAILANLPYPVYGMPKIDGVRAMFIKDTLTGRSLDPFKGFGITELFSAEKYRWLDGEMILGDCPNSEDRLCSLTTGAMGKFKGVTEVPDLHWFVFDYLPPGGEDCTYQERYDQLASHVHAINDPRVHLVPYVIINNAEQAAAFVDECINLNFEGAIFRNPRAKAKPGRPGKLQELMRVKPWVTAEFLIAGVYEGEKNHNPKKRNTLGNTERSSAQAGKVPNGQIGTLYGPLLADVFHPFIPGKLLFPKGHPVLVSAGEMTIAEATDWFRNPAEIVGRIGTFKFMAHGLKDKVRMPIFTGKRLPEDMS